MASLEEDVKDKLVGASIGAFEASSGWGIFIGKMPDRPDTCIVIAHSGGLPADPKWLLDYPNVQVRVRGAKGNYRDAKAKAQEIKDLLLGISSENHAAGRWVAINLLSDVAFLGYDTNERAEFTINFAMITHPTAPAVTNRTALP